MKETITEKELDILCLGIANISVSIKPVSRAVFDTDVTLIEPIEVSAGGDALNESFTASRLGNRTGLISKVGDDVFGRLLVEKAKEAGVSTRYLKVSESSRTASAAMLVHSNGERNICAYRGAFESLCLEDIDMGVFDRCRIVSIGSMFAMKNLDGDGIRIILERAKSSGAMTASDVKFDTYKRGFEGVKQEFPYIDYFLPSYDEALYLTGEREPSRQADFLLRAGCGTIVIKLGPEGCYLSSGDSGKIIPACPKECVDTSGAGDNFVAGFLTGLNKGWDMETCVRFGNATAAVSIQEVGANGAVKSFEQVIEHMRSVNYEFTL